MLISNMGRQTQQNKHNIKTVIVLHLTFAKNQ